MTQQNAVDLSSAVRPANLSQAPTDTEKAANIKLPYVAHARGFISGAHLPTTARATWQTAIDAQIGTYDEALDGHADEARKIATNRGLNSLGKAHALQALADKTEKVLRDSAAKTTKSIANFRKYHTDHLPKFPSPDEII